MIRFCGHGEMASLPLHFLVLLCAPLVALSFDYAQVGTDWTGACKTGQAQSPINIVRVQAVPSSSSLVLTYKRQTSFTLHSTAENTFIFPDYRTNQTLFLDGVPYKLKQAHAHAVSQHTFDGTLSAVEVHLVHTSATNKTAILAVLLNLDAVNGTSAYLNQWLRFAPSLNPNIISLEDYFRFTFLFKSGSATFYTYQGSLDTPPCTQGVTWVVMDPRDSPILSAEQWNRFRVILASTTQEPHNARPVQPLNGRVVKSLISKPL